MANCPERIDEQIYTDKFCCVTDIPIQNLEEYTKYYSNVAIGFNYKKIQDEFNSVLYIPQRLMPRRYSKSFLLQAAMSGECIDNVIAKRKSSAIFQNNAYPHINMGIIE